MRIEQPGRILRARSKLLRSAREFFVRRGFIEVQTPCLGAYPCNEAHLNPFIARPAGADSASEFTRQGADSGVDARNHHAGVPSEPAGQRTDDGAGSGVISATGDAPPVWLRTSPESAMKRLLARTGQDMFQIAPVFRSGENGAQHCEEFNMLEWYRVGYSWQQLLEETFDLLRKCRLNYKRVTQMSWLEWTEAHYGNNLLAMPLDELTALAREHQLHSGGDRDLVVEFLFDLSVRRNCNQGELCVITHYPSQWAVNARCDQDPAWSSRFECFYQGLELVNGCAEVSDLKEQERRFEAQNRLRRQLGRPELAIDRQWLADMPHIPECSGAALGIERLLMAVCGVDNIADLNPLNQTLPFS